MDHLEFYKVFRALLSGTYCLSCLKYSLSLVVCFKSKSLYYSSINYYLLVPILLVVNWQQHFLRQDFRVCPSHHLLLTELVLLTLLQPAA